MNSDVLAGIVRHILTVAAGIVAALTVLWSIKSKGTK